MTDIIPIRSKPGVQKDGTQFDRDYYIDAEWARFQRGLPRKMGGYRQITAQMAEVIYGLHSFNVNARQYLHLGSASLLGQRILDNTGAQVAFNDRTPAGFVPSPNNIWSMDAIYDVNVGDTTLVATGPPNMDIASDDAQPIFYGKLADPAPLVDTTMQPVSGGVVQIGNYLVSFGSAGYIQWNSTANNLTGGTDEDFITSQKIVKGLPVRGGGVPAGLLWSLDSLLILTLNAGGTPIWDSDTVGETSILSSRGVIEYDGVFYWAGVDRFMSYNGVIREVPNQFNVNFFFDNLNEAQRQKVFAYKVPRFGEIWWFFPFGDSVECNHAVILNVREQCWYDTPIPNLGRSDGVYAKVAFKPLLTGVKLGGAGYSLWQHEFGMDEVGTTTEPILSSFETAEVSLIGTEKPEDATLHLVEIEPDFVQSGDLVMTVKGRANARAAVQEVAPVTITEQQEPPAGVTTTNQKALVKTAKRIISIKFESNEPGGDYQMGKVLAHVDKAGGRNTQ